MVKANRSIDAFVENGAPQQNSAVRIIPALQEFTDGNPFLILLTIWDMQGPATTMQALI
jgi:hypothetical protein